jgi:sortase A
VDGDPGRAAGQPADHRAVAGRALEAQDRVLGAPAGRNPQTVRADVTTDGRYALPGREIVDPSAGRVLWPVPDHEGVQPSEALMTMTTCHPKFTASHRMIVYSKLVSKMKNTANLAMPDSVQSLYNEVKA